MLVPLAPALLPNRTPPRCTQVGSPPPAALCPPRRQVVTYKWLARHHAIPYDTAKRVLFKFLTAHGQVGASSGPPAMGPRQQAAWSLAAALQALRRCCLRLLLPGSAAAGPTCRALCCAAEGQGHVPAVGLDQGPRAAAARGAWRGVSALGH